jgi:hypothetical protein
MLTTAPQPSEAQATAGTRAVRAFATHFSRFATLALVTLIIGRDSPHYSCWISCHNGPGCDGFDNHRAGADDGVIADCNWPDQDGPRSNLNTVANSGSSATRHFVPDCDSIAERNASAYRGVIINDQTKAVIKGQSGPHCSLRSQLDAKHELRSDPVRNSRNGRDYPSEKAFAALVEVLTKPKSGQH